MCKVRPIDTYKNRAAGVGRPRSPKFLSEIHQLDTRRGWGWGFGRARDRDVLQGGHAARQLLGSYFAPPRLSGTMWSTCPPAGSARVVHPLAWIWQR